MIRTLAAAGSTLLCVVAALAAPVAPAEAAEGCNEVAPGATPVVLVHGWNSDNSVWSSMAEILRTVPGVSVDDSFSYGPAHTQWVTDPRISRALAERVDCLAARASGGKVVVIAHSMGGLATRCAASVACSGGPDISTKLGTVITLGTPNEGSFLAVNKYGAGAGGAFAKAMALNCKLYPHIPVIGNDAKEICGLLGAVPDPAAKAFAPGSAELKVLPAFPSSIPVSGIAGKVRLTTDLFTHSFPLADNAGDLVVGEQSAHAAAKAVGGIGGSDTVDCGTTGLPIATAWTPPPICWHNTETTSPLFLSKVRATLQKYLDSQKGGTIGLTMQQVADRFIAAMKAGNPTAALRYVKNANPAVRYAAVDLDGEDPRAWPRVTGANCFGRVGVELVAAYACSASGYPATPEPTFMLIQDYDDKSWAVAAQLQCPSVGPCRILGKPDDYVSVY